MDGDSIGCGEDSETPNSIGNARARCKSSPSPPAPTQEPPLSLTPGPSPVGRGEQGRSVPGSLPAADMLRGSLPRGEGSKADRFRDTSRQRICCVGLSRGARGVSFAWAMRRWDPASTHFLGRKRFPGRSLARPNHSPASRRFASRSGNHIRRVQRRHNAGPGSQLSTGPTGLQAGSASKKTEDGQMLGVVPNAIAKALPFPWKTTFSNIRYVATSRLLRDDLPILQNVDGSPVGSCYNACAFGRPPQRSADRFGEFIRIRLRFGTLHGPFSNSRGLSPELSYTDHTSARSR